MSFNRRLFLGGAAALPLLGCRQQQRNQAELTTQLNWLHDPTFVAHYRLSQASPRYRNREGGPSVFPIQVVGSGLVDAAVCGFDIFVKYILDSHSRSATPLRAVFCDFQRNPVGWVLHPRAASQLGIDASAYAAGDPVARQRLLGAIRSRALRVGDKVGTETTSILRTWLSVLGLSDSALVTPVGFDAALVQSAPKLLFPVYLNEEPFRINEAIGGELLVVDPVRDGVAMYGNVVVMREGDPRAAEFCSALADAWHWARDNLNEASRLVGQFYRAVRPETLTLQIGKTVEFAFYGNTPIGTFDLSAGGRVDQSLAMLRRGGSVPAEVNLSAIHSMLGLSR